MGESVKSLTKALLVTEPVADACYEVSCVDHPSDPCLRSLI